MGFRDTFQLSLGLSEGLIDGKADYTLPLGVNDYFFNTYVDYSKFTIIDDEFAAADINSKSTTLGISLSASLFKTSYSGISAGIGLDIKHMELSMFGQPATLTEDFVDGEVNSAPVVFNVNAQYRRSTFVTAMHAGLRRNTNIDLYSSKYEERAFTIGVGQFSMGFRPISKLEWHFRISGQLTRDNLVPVEKFAIGGAKSVRAYRENLLVRDNGLVASTQLRYALYRSMLFVVPFFDYGRSWDFEQGKFGQNGDQIYSAGVGLQLKATKALYTELFWGKALADVDSQTDLTQDYSLHFLIRYTAF
jgi:hemolysin activation/secretion protein